MPSSRFTNSKRRTWRKTARVSAASPSRSATKRARVARSARIAGRRRGEQRLGAREILGVVRVEERRAAGIDEPQRLAVEPGGLDGGEHGGEREPARRGLRAR